ncbi:MAG: 2OG-Fe(II) oxygenase [Flavobacteriaceae bacterium]|nr:2OG-Fe(II) oxygenase [Flavobacteriaceae bacterium]
MKVSRRHIASLIAKNLEDNKEQLTDQFRASENTIGYFVLDGLLPNELAKRIFDNFPLVDKAKLKKSLREHKYVAYQMDKYNRILEETIYAFQDERVVQLIQEICGLKNVYPDEHLYAGGLSMMKKGNFLNPHLDNSHDKDRNRWRVLNLLYYVTPGWKKEYGGNLELWPDGVRGEHITMTSNFNRLVVMATHQSSWHSVSEIINGTMARCCVSNYYFSDSPIKSTDSFHVTSFRGRPSEKIKNVLLRTDYKLRSFLRILFKKGIRENPHKYKK